MKLLVILMSTLFSFFLLADQRMMSTDDSESSEASAPISEHEDLPPQQMQDQNKYGDEELNQNNDELFQEFDPEKVQKDEEQYPLQNGSI